MQTGRRRRRRIHPSDIEKELSMEKRTVVVNNPLTVNCEEKRILSQLYKNLSEKILEDHLKNLRL